MDVMTTKLTSTPVEVTPAEGAVDAASPGTATDITDLLGFKLLRLSNTMGRSAEQQYIGRLGLTLAEWRCLSIVASRGPLAASEVVAAIRTDKAWVSRTIDRLAARDLVRVRPDRRDRRRTLLSATPRGRTLNDAILAAAIDRHEWLLDALSEDHRAIFLSALHALQLRADTYPGVP